MEIQDARTVFPKIRQSGEGWCIPACYEALTQHVCLASPTQDELVMEYHRRFAAEGYINMATRQLHHLTNPTIQDLRAYGFPRGSFVTFTKIANHLLPIGCGK